MKSIQREINKYIVIGLFILFILLIFIIDNEMKVSIVPRTMDLAQEIVNSKSEEISSWLEERVLSVADLGYNIELLDFNRAEALDYLNEIALANSNYESLGIVDGQGNAYISDGSVFLINNRKYYQEVEGSEKIYVISDPIKSRSNEKDIVIILHKLNREVECMDYISAAVPIKAIVDMAAKTEIYDRGSIIYDSQGQAIGSNELEHFGEDEEIITFKAPITKSNKWTVKYNIAKDKLYEASKRLKNSVLLLGLIIISLSFFLIRKLTSSIVRPIREIQGTMELVENGNLDIRFSHYRKDELGQLQKSFDRMLDNLYKAKYEKRELEFELIQEQINPHFLYNTLDTIRWAAVESDEKQVISLIEALSSYFRIGLSSGSKYIKLRDEIKHTEIYLEIYEARFEKKVNYEIIYDEKLLDLKLIKIILQPLVENALNHSRLDEEMDKLKIRINIYEEEGKLILQVINNGSKIEENRLEEIYEKLNKGHSERVGFGLYSVNQRLKLDFGNDYGVSIFNRSDGVETRVTCPIIKEDYND